MRALASHRCGAGLFPGVDAICGLSLLLVLILAPKGFSPGTQVLSCPEKPTLSNFNSIWNAWKHLNEFSLSCRVGKQTNNRKKEQGSCRVFSSTGTLQFVGQWRSPILQFTSAAEKILPFYPTTRALLWRNICIVYSQICVTSFFSRNAVPFTPTQVEAIRAGMQPGLTMVRFWDII